MPTISFNTLKSEVDLGFILAALAVLFSWRWYLRDGPRFVFLLSTLCAMLAVGRYQPYLSLRSMRQLHPGDWPPSHMDCFQSRPKRRAPAVVHGPRSG